VQTPRSLDPLDQLPSNIHMSPEIALDLFVSNLAFCIVQVVEQALRAVQMVSGGSAPGIRTIGQSEGLKRHAELLARLS